MTKSTEKEGGRCGRGGGIRVATVSAVLIMTGIAGLGLFSQAARAGLSVTHNGWNGYQGNQVIYMTTGVTDTANPIDISTITSPVGTQSSPNLPNSLQFKVGQAVNTTLQKLIANEYYDWQHQVMRIYLPITVGSGSAVAILQHNDVEMVFWQKVSVAGSTGTGQTIDTNYNSGINATRGSTYGVGQITNPQLAAIYNLTWDALGFLPGVGFVTGSYSVMRDLEHLAGVDSSTSLTNTQSSGTTPAYETFDTPIPLSTNCPKGICSVLSQQVFAPQTYLELTISQSQFTTSSGFVVTASNTFGVYDPKYGSYSVTACTGCSSPQGAATSLTIPAYPADTLKGTIYAVGNAVVPNQAFTLSTTDASGDYFAYNLQTDAQGNYRFMAQPGAAYAICATYPTSFGGTYGCNSATMPNTEGNATLNLQLPVSSLFGTVTDASSGGAISGATVSITNPSASLTVNAITNSYGGYIVTVKDQGTYSLDAAASGYSGQAKSATVSAWGIAVGTDFSLSLSGGGGGGPGGGGGCKPACLCWNPPCQIFTG